MPEARVNGIRLYYEEHGAGAPIACVHGNARTSTVGGGHMVDPAGPDVLRFIEEVLG